MNPRHAAALALVGWYLMIPPIKNSVRHFCGMLNMRKFAGNRLKF